LREEARAAHRKDTIGHQFRHGVARICSAAEANREVNAGSTEIEEARACDQLQLDVRVQGAKIRQSRGQSPRRDGWQHGDRQPPRVVPQVKFCDCAGDVGDGLVYPLCQDLASARQFETAREAIEQKDAEFLLECSHAMANRTLR
jgi:hypothetical protein